MASETGAGLPTARIVRTRAALAQAIATWPAAGPAAALATTWALVAVAEIPSTYELAALREAARLCDKVAAVVIGTTPAAAPKTLPTLPALLREAGADVAWVPAPDKPLLTISAADGTDLRVLLQALMAVLPSVVVVNRNDSQRVRQWRLLQTEFGEVVDLVIKA